MKRTRERALFVAVFIVFVALWVLKSALHIAGGAMRIILLIVIVFAVIAWASSKVAR